MTLLMVTFFMSVSMISCDDDDEKNGGQTAKEMLVGQWVLIKDMTDINGETDTEEYPAEAREEILTFKADGSCSCQWPSENRTEQDFELLRADIEKFEDEMFSDWAKVIFRYWTKQLVEFRNPLLNELFIG